MAERNNSDRDSLLDRAYDVIAGEDDDRSCESIPDSACKDVPASFFLNVGNGTCTKLAEQIASPGLVLPWLLAAIGAPIYLAGLLVPIRQAGAMGPQLIIAGAIRGFSRRKFFWVGAGLVQGIALAAMIPAVLYLPPHAAGWAIVSLLAIFSVASGVGSVSFKDVVAKTIPKGRRGRLLAIRASLGGALATAAGLSLRVWGDDEGTNLYVILLGVAAALWIVGAFLFAAIPEPAGVTDGGRSALREAIAGWKILGEQRGFRHFIAARSLLALGVALSTPFFALLVHNETSGNLASLGIIVAATSIASVISSPFWGWMSDRSSRQVLIAAGCIGCVTAVVAVLLIPHLGGVFQTVLFSVIFVALGLSQAGNKLGRKTYLVDGAPEKDRPTWVAVANTIVGLVTLAASGLGLIAEWITPSGLILVLACFTALGVFFAWLMPEAEQLVHKEGIGA
ncbi:MAG: MFS transporter [Candidatus Sumerlaeia bacterium]|nr:MFS transporter [Candidatus Sumerlaeia bacterium]